MKLKVFRMLVLGAVLTLSACHQTSPSQELAPVQTEVAKQSQVAGWEKVKPKVLEALGLSEKEVENVWVEEDYEATTPVYDVELIAKGQSYSLTVEQSTGNILESSSELLEVATDTAITDFKAKEIALADAGLKEQEVMRLRLVQDSDDGRVTYEVEFSYQNQDYSYTIDAQSGAILEKDMESVGD